MDKSQLVSDAFGASWDVKKNVMEMAYSNLDDIGKYGKVVKGGAKIVAGAGMLLGAYDAGQDFIDGRYKSGTAKLIVTGAATAASFIPVVGWGVALGIGVADYFWGDEFYDWLEK